MRLSRRDLIAILSGYGFEFDGEIVRCQRCKRRWRLRRITDVTVRFLAAHRRGRQQLLPLVEVHAPIELRAAASLAFRVPGERVPRLHCIVGKKKV